MTGGSLAGENTSWKQSRAARARGVLGCGVCVALLVAAGMAGGCQRSTGIGEKPRALSPGRIVGGPGDAPGHFIKPRVIDSDGEHLVVIDRSGRVQVLEPGDGRCVAVWRLPETHLGYPTGLTLGPSPRGDGVTAVWVADTHYNRVLVYAMPKLPTDGSMNTDTPELLLSFGKYGTGEGEFTYPSDVLVVTGGDGKAVTKVFVSEFGGNDRVSVFEPVGTGKSVAMKFTGQIGHAGAADDGDGFQRPQSLTLRKGDGAGRGDELIVSDSVNHRIGRFSLDGKLIAWLNKSGVPGRGAGQFWHPRGVLMLKDGTAMVVEFGNNRLQQVNLDTGECLGLFGAAGKGEGELAEPWAVAAVGRQGFVVDAHNHRLVEMKLPSAGLHFAAGSGTVSTLAKGAAPSAIGGNRSSTMGHP